MLNKFTFEDIVNKLREASLMYQIQVLNRNINKREVMRNGYRG